MISGEAPLPGHFHTTALLCTRACPGHRSRPDPAAVEWFAAWLRDPGKVPMPGCPGCERVSSLGLEPGQVASCGEHSYVRKGQPPG